MAEDKTKQRARAWDSVNKEMHYNFQSMWIKSGSEEETPSGIIFSSDLYTPSFEKWPPEDDILRRFSIMEWVHAVDSINMPIYECDLLSVKGKEKGWVGIAFWGNAGKSLCWDINEIKNERLCEYAYFNEEGATFTVIGNVYENPDIVKHLTENKILKFDLGE